jgi:extracellular elastinolytic metalloproteinase
MENDIVIHELTHGITNRMTGGGTGRCLQSTEAAGLGEGWSDAMAEYVVFLSSSLCGMYMDFIDFGNNRWFQHKDGSIGDFAVGQFVSGNDNGIRRFPYSTDS